MPSHEEVAAAMEVLKAAGCQIDTKIRNFNDPTSIVFVIYVPLTKADAGIEEVSQQ